MGQEIIRIARRKVEEWFEKCMNDAKNQCEEISEEVVRYNAKRFLLIWELMTQSMI